MAQLTLNSDAEPVKSQGHVMFYGRFELWRAASGDVYYAPISDTLNTYGVRCGGRFFCTRVFTDSEVARCAKNILPAD